MKVLIWKESKQGRPIGTVHEVNEADVIDSYSGNFFNMMEKVDLPEALEGKSVEELKGVKTSSNPDVWEVQAKENADYDKPTRIQKKHTTLTKDVHNQMEQVFGTKKPDTAIADYLSWLAMERSPAKFSGAGLKARIAVTGFATGDDINTDNKITDYATKCLDLAGDYAVFREQKIIAFGLAKITIENE